MTNHNVLIWSSQYSPPARDSTAAILYTEISESDTDIFIEMRMKHFRVVTIRRDKIRWARAGCRVRPRRFIQPKRDSKRIPLSDENRLYVLGQDVQM